MRTMLLSVAALFSLCTGVANAGLVILNSNILGGGVQATAETALDGGPGFPCTTCTTAVTTYGYTSITTSTLNVVDPGTYQFTFEGAGDSLNSNTFTVAGQTFTANGPGGTGAGSSAAGSTFNVFLPAGLVPFTLTSSGGCSISDGGAPSLASGCNYLVALANSPTAPGATTLQNVAFIGFSDAAAPADHDYQDLVVRVAAVPEPSSVALMGAGLAALLLLVRRRTAMPV